MHQVRAFTLPCSYDNDYQNQHAVEAAEKTTRMSMTSKRIPILYGTETGNAEYCADLLAEAIEEEGFRVEPVDMGHYEPETIRSEYLVFVIVWNI